MAKLCQVELLRSMRNAHRILGKLGVVYDSSSQSDRDDWTLAMVSAGLGFAIMPVSAVIHPDVVGVPFVAPEVWRQINFVPVRGRAHP